jgi:transcriptional regulator with XRE-family HTH domain
MKRNERLRTAIEKVQSDNNYSQADIMRVLKYASPNYLSELIAGKKEITAKFLRRLEEKLFIRQKWIEIGEGEMSIDVSDALEKLINDRFPELQPRHKKVFQALLKIMAEIKCEATKKPYQECLYDIFDEIDRSASS